MWILSLQSWAQHLNYSKRSIRQIAKICHSFCYQLTLFFNMLKPRRIPRSSCNNKSGDRKGSQKLFLGQLLPLGCCSFRVTSAQSMSQCKLTTAKLKVQFSLVTGTVPEEKREDRTEDIDCMSMMDCRVHFLEDIQRRELRQLRM